MLADFNYAAYGELLDRLLDANVNIGFPEAATTVDPYFILRHDVDFSPEPALRMAEFEARRNVRATYFVLLSAADYNLLDSEHCRFPRQLVELGHDVGLHYDVATFEHVAPDARRRFLHLQAEVVSTLSTATVDVISMHNPSLSGEDPFRVDSGFLNAYDDRFTREIAYVSDSCGAWRDEAATLLEADRLPPRLQLLVHPLFWGDVHWDRWSVLNHLVERRTRTVHDRAGDIGACWAAHTGVIQHDRRLSGVGASAAPGRTSTAQSDVGRRGPT